MSFVSSLKEQFYGLKALLASEDEEPKNIGIYGPPNAGKTTLANQIIEDWTVDDDANAEVSESDDEMDAPEKGFGETSQIPHETRRTERKRVTIEKGGNTVEIDVVDTPGVTTEVDYQELVEYNDMEEDEAVERSREATEGVAEAMHWLREDIDGVIYVLDATEDPFQQVNTMLIGIIESRDLPVLIFANKTDLDDANVSRVENAFPQHTVIELSALEGTNMETAYEDIAEHFG